MAIKKLQLDGLNPESPLSKIQDNLNENLDAIIEAFDNVNDGAGVIGPAGPKGDKGDPGATGATGPQGERGEKGNSGEPGPPGADGDQGPQGLPGKDGTDGKDGLPGAQGPIGATGPKGDTGAQGPAGAKGDTGAQGPVGVGILGFASGYVNAGTFVTLDNLKATVTTGGARGISVASVSGSFTASIGAHYMYSYASAEGTATAWPGHTTTVTPSGSWFNWSFGNAGDTAIYYVNDYNNKRFYRITMMIGHSYNNNFISIERLA